VHLMKLNYT